MHRFQFALRSLLLFVLFVSVVLSALASRLWLMVEIGDAFFWLLLLSPFWIPQFFVAPEIRQTERILPLVGLAAAIWYCVLILLFHYARQSYLPALPCKVVGIVGTLIVCVFLLRSRQLWWYIIVMPLVFATVSGTVWLVVY